MTSTPTSIILGSLIGLGCLISIVLNICILIVLKTGKFLSPNQSPVYIFAFANITGNLLTMTVYVGYLAPSSIAQSFLFSDDKNYFWVRFMGFLFHALWLTDLLTQVVASVNRAIVVLKPSGSRLFTRNKTIFFSFLTFFLGFLFASIGNLLLPCCS